VELKPATTRNISNAARLPITSDKKLFRKLAGKGKELVALHLLKSSKVDDFVTTYPESGDNKVEFVRPDRFQEKSVKRISGQEQRVGKPKLRGNLSPKFCPK
jgi:hypothetical protein